MSTQTLTLRYGALILFLILGNWSCSSAPEKKAVKMHWVQIKQMQFQPSELVVQKGDSVTFINKDMVVHDVTEENNKAWNSSPLSPNQSYSMVVNESADYYCSIHPVMKGKLRVQ